MKPSKKWMATAKVYVFFAKAYDFECADFSDEAALKMYQAESLGGSYKFSYHEKFNGNFNGYALGKHFMDLQLKMWKEDIIDGILLKRELIFDDSDIQEFVDKFVETI
jgi:hypothetical protein